MGNLLDTADKNLENFDSQKVGFFRFRKLDGEYLITNDSGGFAHLPTKQFDQFVQGILPARSSMFRQLQRKGFLRQYLDFPKLVADWKKANAFLWQAPGLHMIVVTLRCNFACVYCHAASVKMNQTGYDMTVETAQKVVDRIFESPSQTLAIEFQGGIPQALALMNGPFVTELTSPLTGDLVAALVDSPFLTDQQRVDTLYLATLTRLPRDAERRQTDKWIKSCSEAGDSAQAFGDTRNLDLGAQTCVDGVE